MSQTKGFVRVICLMAMGVVAVGASASAQPDLIVGRISGIGEYGTVNGISAYAIGTTACNAGDVWLSWRDSGAFSNQHPVIAQNLFRLKDGAFEQLGMSWLKHGFCAADSTVCGSCQNASGCDWLGLGCSDTYGWGLNGSQTYLGPRNEVNPSTGYFPFPHSSPTGHSTLRGRLLVAIADLDPSLNAGALYFGESEYITPDDAGTSTANNNNTYARVNVGNLSSGIYNLEFTGPLTVGDPAIFAWQDQDPGVVLKQVDIAGDGRFWVGYRTTDNGDGTWHYEYAIYNLNSDRAAGSFSIPVGPGVSVTNVAFHDVDYHSGEPYDNTDWSSSASGGSVTWSSPATFDVNPDSNALRWGTMYSYRFDASGPPVSVAASIGLFRPGSPDEVLFPAMGPEGSCAADFNGDGIVNTLDFLAFLNAFSAGDPSADFNGDGVVNTLDFLAFLNAFNAGC